MGQMRFGAISVPQSHLVVSYLFRMTGLPKGANFAQTRKSGSWSEPKRDGEVGLRLAHRLHRRRPAVGKLPLVDRYYPQ